MIFGSVCSGIEAASVGWHPLGWRAAFVSEIDRFPSAVLAHHYPDVPNRGDMTKFKEWPDAAIDVLVGGTPCQSFSVAGLRKGLADPRGNLMLTYLGIAARYRPTWLVWENVPGVLSSNGGRDFGALLGGLAELGYGFAYRVLDAQYFGLAQRRKRVFVVGCLGDWRRAAAVLFERESLSGHPAPRREPGKDVAPTIRAGVANGSAGHGARSGDTKDELIVPILHSDVAPTISGCANGGGANGPGRDVDSAESLIIAPELARCDATREGSSQDYETTTMVAHALRADGFDASEDGTGRGKPLVPIAFSGQMSTPQTDSNLSSTLGRKNPMAVAFDLRGREHGSQFEGPHDTANLRAASGGSSRSYVQQMQVRRLTPRECERLQGFPDDYTLIWRKGKLAADGPRYKALGNSMAVPVMAWIGRRIQQVAAITKEIP